MEDFKEFLKITSYAMPFKEEDVVEAHRIGMIEAYKKALSLAEGTVVEGVLHLRIDPKKIEEKIKELRK